MKEETTKIHILENDGAGTFRWQKEYFRDGVVLFKEWSTRTFVTEDQAKADAEKSQNMYKYIL